jgi:ribosomal protein S18 acetylase RimI-like enzyme
MNGTGSTRSAATAETLAFRLDPAPHDRRTVREIVESTGFFSPEEIGIAVELVGERLARGPASGYEFVFAEIDGRTVGYACYGRVAATRASYELYWIAVRRDCQRRGLGRALLAKAESLVHRRGGTRIYADTSGREQYASTRAFYESAGYRREAVLRDFFAPGDDKVILAKVLLPEDPAG